MKKIAIILTLFILIFLLVTGTANALVLQYYDGFEYMGEPAAMLLLGTGLMCVAGIGRKKLVK